MVGQVVTVSDGQTYSTLVADTILAGAGSETVQMYTGGGFSFDAPNSNVFAVGGTIVLPSGAASLNAVSGQIGSPAIFFDGAASGELSSGQIVAQGVGGATSIDGGGADSIWAGNVNLSVFQMSGSSRAVTAFEHDFNFVFDAGSSNSTVVAAGGSVGLPSPVDVPIDASGTAFVGNGGVLNFGGSSNQVTLVAGAGSNTVNAAAATGQGLFVASIGNSSLVGGSGNDFFVLGTGADTVAAGSAAAALIVLNGTAGGQDVVQNWSAADQIYLFGYGSNGVASQQVVGGSLQLQLTDRSLITLTGVTSIASGQLHFG